MRNEGVPQRLSIYEKRARLIVALLDDMVPIPEDAPPDMVEALDIERQVLAMNSGWNHLSHEELETYYLRDGGHDTLPY